MHGKDAKARSTYVRMKLVLCTKNPQEAEEMVRLQFCLNMSSADAKQLRVLEI